MGFSGNIRSTPDGPGGCRYASCLMSLRILPRIPTRRGQGCGRAEAGPGREVEAECRGEDAEKLLIVFEHPVGGIAPRSTMSSRPRSM